MGFNDWIGATWTSVKVAILTIFVAQLEQWPLRFD